MKIKFIVFLLLFGATACSPRKTAEVSKPLASYTNENPVNIDTEQFANTQVIEDSELTLAQALALTLEKNSELKSYSQSLRIGEARIIQAGLRPNPELSLVVEDVFGTNDYDGIKRSQSTLQLSQIIELGEKRNARINASTALSDQFKNEYEIKRVEILSNLADKFIRTATDERLLELAKKGKNLAVQALLNIKKRMLAGGVSELEEAKARVLVARASIEVEHAEHELLSSKHELAMFWGNFSPKFLKLSTDLFQTVSLPSFEELNLRIDNSLEIKKWVSEKRLREAEQKLAEAKKVPNLLLGAGPRRIETSDNQTLVFQISAPLSIFDRNQGARQEAKVLRDKVDFDGDILQLRLKTNLFALYQEAKHAKTVLEAMKDEIIPQAERSLKIAQNGYDQGRLSYLELLDAQRTLLEVSRENIEAAYRLHSYVNSIERLLGAPLNSKELK